MWQSCGSRVAIVWQSCGNRVATEAMQNTHQIQLPENTMQHTRRVTSKQRSQSLRKIQIKRHVSVGGPCIAFIPPARSVHPAAPLQPTYLCWLPCPLQVHRTPRPAGRSVKTEHGLPWAVKHSIAGASVRLTAHAQLTRTCAQRCSCLGLCSKTMVFLVFSA